MMKIALITDDGQTISQHFGRAPYYLVVTLEEGQEVQREMREKLGHNHFASQETGDAHSHDDRHGFDPASHNRHTGMAQAISDCQVIICGGMGAGAYESMRQLNIQPIVTQLRGIDESIQAYLAGNLKDRTDLLH
jgi:predicted Fe-Mo cluster-binding NifX family protein